jgi:hypothetical protein
VVILCLAIFDVNGQNCLEETCSIIETGVNLANYGDALNKANKAPNRRPRPRREIAYNSYEAPIQV